MDKPGHNFGIYLLRIISMVGIIILHIPGFPCPGGKVYASTEIMEMV